MRVFLNTRKSSSNFADVLDDVTRSAGMSVGAGPRYERPSAARPSTVRTSRFEQIGEIARDLRMSMFSSLLESYLEHHNTRRPPRQFPSVEPQAISDELSISERMTVGELNRLRRKFALANHPDRVERDERENATRRMMVANMLIDRAVKRRMVR